MLNQLDEYTRKYLIDLLGEEEAERLQRLPGGVSDRILKEKIRERGLRERGPRYSRAFWEQ